MLTNSEVEELLRGMIIRRIRNRDFAQLFELIRQAFRREAVITGLSVDRLTRAAKFYRLIEVLLPVLDVLHRDFETILVAVSEGKLIGEIHLTPHGKKIWSIASSAVDTMFRRRGVYKKLLREALRYVSKKHGRRAVLSVRADNIPAMRAYDRLGFEIFERELLLRLELDEFPVVEFDGDASVRGVKSSDVEEVHEIRKAVSPRRVEAYKMAPRDFLDSFMSYIMNIIAWSYSKKWVMEMRGEIVGYVHFTFTPPQEAAKIESFYVRPSSNSSKLIGLLLRKVLRFLTTRNIRKVTTSLNEEWKETIEIFKRFGFKPVASLCQMTKELA